MKQALIIRTDLKMGKGKIASQASHASIASFLKSNSYTRNRWMLGGMKKVVLRVRSLRQLKALYKKSKAERIPCELITDAGRTQLKKPTVTALGIGPARDDEIDKITGKLKLL